MNRKKQLSIGLFLMIFLTSCGESLTSKIEEKADELINSERFETVSDTLISSLDSYLEESRQNNEDVSSSELIFSIEKDESNLQTEKTYNQKEKDKKPYRYHPFYLIIKELNLTEIQNEELKTILSELKTEFPKPESKDMELIKSYMENVKSELETRIQAILTAEQLLTFTSLIQLQKHDHQIMRGYKKVLSLTPDQKNTLITIIMSTKQAQPTPETYDKEVLKKYFETYKSTILTALQPYLTSEQLMIANDMQEFTRFEFGLMKKMSHELDLNDDQVNTLRSIIRTTQTTLPSPINQNKTTLKTYYDSFFSAISTELNSVLTNDQQEKLAAMRSWKKKPNQNKKKGPEKNKKY